MSDAYPVIDEFGKGATTCPSGNQRGTGCAVCSTAAILVRWGKPIPRLADGTPNMVELGREMGVRHRQADPGIRHGLSLLSGQQCTGAYWCAYCAYLTLKAHGVPVAYGFLTNAQINAQLDAKHPIVLPGDYWQVPLVDEDSFSATIPARGRVQRSFASRPFWHMVVAWERNSQGVIVSDPDFGSYAGAPVPPHSIWTSGTIARFWGAGEWSVCYAVTAPPKLGAPPPMTGVTYRYGGRPTSRGSYIVREGVRVRTSPYVRDDNVITTTTKPTTFGAAQATYAGTNVDGSTLWLGTKDGRHWAFRNLCRLVGHTTGNEAIK